MRTQMQYSAHVAPSDFLCAGLCTGTVRGAYNALHLSWPAENKAKRFSRLLTFAFGMKISSQMPYFERQNRIAFFFLVRPTQTQSTLCMDSGTATA